MHNIPEESDLTNKSSAVGIYTERWFLLAATCINTTLNLFLSKSFSTANEILVVYFQVSLMQLDWACLGLYAGTTLITPLVAYLCFAKLIGFRMMAICGCFCSLLSCSCILLTIRYPFLFSLMVGASLLQGVAYCASFSLGTFFAVLWFPDNQVGLAIAFNSAAMVGANILGAVIPPALLKIPLMPMTQQTFQRNSSSNLTKWKIQTFKDLICLYSTVAIILILLLLFFLIFAKDLPPKPPTLALAQKQLTDDNLKETNKSWGDFVTSTKELFQDRTYLLSNFISGVAYCVGVVEMLHLSQLVNVIIQDSNSASLISGYIVIAFAASSFTSAFLSAKILLYFQQHTGQIIVGTGILFGSGICLILSYHYKFLVGFYMGNITLGAGIRICMIPLLDVITRHTYPKDETVVSAWLAGTGSVIFIILTEISRLLTNHTSASSALILMAVVLFFVFLSSFFFKPKINRDKAEQQLLTSKTKMCESTSFIQKS